MPSMLMVLTATISSSVSATPPPNSWEIATNVWMPKMNLGTCCGSDPTVGLLPWLKAGGIGIDTAYSYTGSQIAIASVLASPAASKWSRADLFITTKICQTECTGVPLDACAKKLLQQDLNRLNTTYVDLVLIHHPGNDRDNALLWKSLEAALAAGKTRAIGVSNFNPAQLAALPGRVPAVNQIHLSVGTVVPMLSTLAYCAQKFIAITAFDVLKGCPYDNGNLVNIAAAHNVTTAQVCLRFVLQLAAPANMTIAAGTGSDPNTAARYATEDLDVFGFILSASEMAVISDTPPPINNPDYWLYGPGVMLVIFGALTLSAAMTTGAAFVFKAVLTRRAAGAAVEPEGALNYALIEG